MDTEKTNNENLNIVTGVESRDIMFPSGSLVSIKDEEDFDSIVLRSIDRDIADPVLKEIRAKREGLKVINVIVCAACLVFLGLLSYAFFPRVTQIEIDDGEDDNSLVVDESEGDLISQIKMLLPSERNPEPSLRVLSDSEMHIIRKYRQLNMSKCPSAYVDQSASYIEMLGALSERYENSDLKKFYIEGVLKSFPFDESGVGLMCYYRQIKTHGDAGCTNHVVWLACAIRCCDDFMFSLDEDKDDTKKLFVKFQKAELLMYRWLAENVKKKKGLPLRSIPDDKDDLGVAFREDAVKILVKDDWMLLKTKMKTKKGEELEIGKELYNQCIKILIEDASWCNRVYFDQKSYWGFQLEKRFCK